MSVKAVREHHGKNLLAQAVNRLLPEDEQFTHKSCSVCPEVLIRTSYKTWAMIEEENPWLLETKLVAKPDQLIKRRGKAGLVAVDLTFEEAKQWIKDRMYKEVEVDGVKGELTHFIIEPFVPHAQEDEYYVCIQSNRYTDDIYFTHEGGVNVGDVDAKALTLKVETEASTSVEAIAEHLLIHAKEERRPRLARFILALFEVFRELHFTYLEINPLVMLEKQTFPLDLAAKIDETAHFLCGVQWGEIDLPPPFGRAEFPEELKIRAMDARSGASLKLTILNEHGRVWTMVAGGGASVVYADTVADKGFAHELANYGEYSGAPTTEETYEYSKTLFGLMTKYHHPEGKVLIIGGGIANFTNVAATFTGLIQALRIFATSFKEHKVTIWVRRAGPNYKEGLRNIKAAARELDLPMYVYGPETHMTSVVSMGLGLIEPREEPDLFSADGQPNGASATRMVDEVAKAKAKAKQHGTNRSTGSSADITPSKNIKQQAAQVAWDEPCVNAITADTVCFIYGAQYRAIQGMLDFDYFSKRKKPSVGGIVYPFEENRFEKFYWGTSEILIPLYQNLATAVEQNPHVSVYVNFASFRSIYDTVLQALEFPSLKTIAIIAEGVPERQTRIILKRAEERGVTIIGPATVGGIFAGRFRIGNTGGMLDNIVMSRLYRPGSVAYVSKSGGMSNELNNMISRTTDGVAEGIAIGGDRYPGSRFVDHLLRFESLPEVKMLVLFGEVGGTDEYEVIEAVRRGRIKKPMIGWCIGTVGEAFNFEVQFGHAGAQARGRLETAKAKNEAMRAVGIHVPNTFDELPSVMEQVYLDLLQQGVIVPREEPEVPTVPMDFTWAKNLGMVRKPANFITSITDERGDELKYNNMLISDIVRSDLGLGGVIGLLWLRQRLPAYCCRFIEQVLMLTADHGPAVSGAHNTIVTARAGKDLISSLVAGLVTIGPRFGGAIDEAAVSFGRALGILRAKDDEEPHAVIPSEYVKMMKQRSKLIMGIGHRVKSLANPDRRVELLKEFAFENFTEHRVLDYALQVEQITTQKKANLILNVDGAIAACFVDMLLTCGVFQQEEVEDLLELGVLNGLFALGRSIGFIAHYVDQKRLKQPLYRHPWDDIAMVP